METKKYSIDLGGRELTLEFTNWVEQASASVLAKYGETVVLTTVVMGKSEVNLPYFPLTVEYREKYYAAGKIGGGRFNKREARPSDEATLKARLIDRTIRPLFNEAMRRDVQVVNTILSYDEENAPDMVALIAASCALNVSNIPWDGPIGALRIGKKGDDLVVNPSHPQQEENDFNVVIAGPDGKINMIETDAKEASETDVLETMKEGQKIMQQLIEFQAKIRKDLGKEKEEVKIHQPNKDLQKEINDLAEKPLTELIFEKNEAESSDKINEIRHKTYETLEEKHGEEGWHDIRDDVSEYFENLVKKLVHKAVLEKDKRLDGRKLDEVRPLSGQVDILPRRTHGSGLFMRGLTHGLSTVTLDAPGEEELSDEMEGESKKRFMLHYNFPPYSTGETGFFRGPGRREIGHGALAEKALAPLIPPKEEFSYVVRVVTEVLSSNGSTSMASVCSGSLALMDAGVPVKKHIAGIAMGIISDGKNHKILTDIQGAEDHWGGMDFKVAGTRDGVTAVQLDVKIQGLTLDLIEQTLEKAKQARMQILDVLEGTIAEPRKELSPYAPIIKMIQINPERIGMLIGAGGRIIKDLMAETNTDINVEDDGTVSISGKDKEKVEKAIELATNLTKEIKVGEIFDAKVIKIADFGAFVELVPGQEALVHISELKEGFVKSVEEVVKTGDLIKVKVIKIDEQGKIGASAKAVQKSDDKTDSVEKE